MLLILGLFSPLHIRKTKQAAVHDTRPKSDDVVSVVTHEEVLDLI
jgi:hypothetical protein